MGQWQGALADMSQTLADSCPENLSVVEHQADSPDISVVITTFNRLQLFRETLDSILAQSFKNFEILVIDNCSTDGTEEYLSALNCPNLRYVRSANNGIIAINRNLGLVLARGRYVAFCDDDDLWEPEKLQHQAGVFAADPSLSICCTRMRTFSNRIFDNPSPGYSGLITLNRLIYKNIIGTSSTLVNKLHAIEVGGFDESGRFSPYDDFEFWVRMAAHGRIFLLPEQLVLYRIHASNVSPNRRRRIKLFIEILLAARHKVGIGGLWFWFCIGLRWVQFTLLSVRERCLR